MNIYFFKCHNIKMINFVLCNIFERIWYSESILVMFLQLYSIAFFYTLGQNSREVRFRKNVYTFPYLTQSLADGFPHLLSSWATADLIWHLARTLPCGRYLLLYIGLVVHNLQCLLQKISCNSLVMVLCMFLHT